jgi:hypothetical protein
MSLRAANLVKIAALSVAAALPCAAATLPAEFFPSNSAQPLPPSNQSVVTGLVMLALFFVCTPPTSSGLLRPTLACLNGER